MVGEVRYHYMDGKNWTELLMVSPLINESFVIVYWSKLKFIYRCFVYSSKLKISYVAVRVSIYIDKLKKVIYAYIYIGC
jgi:hypothetical protein